MSGKAIIYNGNALSLPLPDESVDLIITSPPYFALRSYRDGGEHYEGQIGSEPTPQDFLEALWAATAEMKRVLKPSGSIWVNLGDKYAGSGGYNNSNIAAEGRGPTRYQQNGRISHNPVSGIRRYDVPTVQTDIPRKSLMGLPWRYAIGCIDQLGLILRAEVIWSKPNGLPESVTDRVRRSHEQWFHFTKQGRYFAAVDEVREPHLHPDHGQIGKTQNRKRPPKQDLARATDAPEARVGFGGEVEPHFINPLGKLPGSVWTIPSEPLRIPDDVKASRNLPDHFAAFPSAWPVRIIAGWSPSGICTACGEPRRPVVQKGTDGRQRSDSGDGGRGTRGLPGYGDIDRTAWSEGVTRTVTGYACACDDPTAPTTPAVVLDPFGGTGTVAMVAKQLGRVGISVDLSADYCRLAEWRCNESDHGPKAIAKARKKGLLRSEEVQQPPAGRRSQVRRNAEPGVPAAGTSASAGDNEAHLVQLAFGSGDAGSGLREAS